MAELATVVTFLDRELRTREIQDYSGAMNGLQLENPGGVEKVALAVDASGPVIQKALAIQADLLLVHHGLFWQGAQPFTGPMFRKIKAAIEGGMAIYSSHLPLDVHPEWGNNVRLARAMGIETWTDFLEWKGMPMGLQAEVDWSRDELLARVQQAVGGAVHHCPGGRERIRSVGVITGGAGSQVADAAAAGVDAFVTGEGPHWSYPLAEELEINVFYGGHYATETFGVRALGELLSRKFGLSCHFLDHPTGL
ncbi:MAG: Nif3-like dinuclear metal center hexameric protein [Verrucomicrobiales bacterium]